MSRDVSDNHPVAPIIQGGLDRDVRIEVLPSDAVSAGASKQKKSHGSPAKPNRSPRSRIPQGEDKAAKFSRLATKRVCRVLQTLRHIGNLSSTINYVYTQDQVSAIFAAITDATNVARDRFLVSTKKAPEFKV